MTVYTIQKKRHLTYDTKSFNPSTDEFIVTSTCPMCGNKTNLRLSMGAFVAWLDDEHTTLVQNAFPTLTLDEREALITGYCATCWEKINEP